MPASGISSELSSSNFSCAAVPGYCLSSHGSLSSCPTVGSLHPLGMAPQTGQRSWHLSLLLPIMASYGTVLWYGCITSSHYSWEHCGGPSSKSVFVFYHDAFEVDVNSTRRLPLFRIAAGGPTSGADRSPYFFMLVLFSAVLFQVAFNFRDVRTCFPGRVRLCLRGFYWVALCR